MIAESQAHAVIRIAMVQAALTALIATFSGCWAYTTYIGDQRRISETRNREQRQAQDEAIAQMSRQIGLMEAQCDEDVQLRTLLDDQARPTTRQERCYEAYIGARSLLYLSQVRIRSRSTLSYDDWTQLWADFEQALVRAGAVTYSADTVSTAWETIVDNSVKP